MDDTTFDPVELPNIGGIDILSSQQSDEDIAWWIPYVESGRKPTWDQVSGSTTHQTMFRNFDRLKRVHGVLFRIATIDGQERKQVIVPKVNVPLVLQLAHDDMGHQGRDKTMSLIRDRFFWCGMSKDVEEHVKRCSRCLRRKSTSEKAPLIGITTYQPLELVCMDFLSLELSKGGFQNILVITDHFTRYAVAVPTRNQTAKTTAEAFVNNFVVHYGLPLRIHSDQGANFESKIIKEICAITEMKKSHTTPYHPMGNGLCERFNRTLLGMLGTLDPSKKCDWKSHVAPLVHAYNCTRQDSTGFSPYHLMFGREPNLPMDLIFDLVESDQKSQTTTKYAEKLKQRLEDAYKLAGANTDKARRGQKRNYDRKVKNAVIEPGDLVLVRKVAFDGKHKIADRWEEEPYLVLTQPNEGIPVYKVKKQNGDGRVRTLHRNLLLPLATEEKTDTSIVLEKKRPMPAPRVNRNNSSNSEPATEYIQTGVTDTDEEEEDDIEILIPIASPEETEEGSSDDDTASEAEEHQETDGDAHTDSDQVSDKTDVDEIAVIGNEKSRISPPIPARRSQRARRPPERFRSGDYIMSLQTPPDWKQRADYLRQLTDSSILQRDNPVVLDALLKIVTNN